MDVELRADNAGFPGAILETLPLIVNNGTSLGPLSVTSTALPQLAPNTQYWLVLHGTANNIAAGKAGSSANSGPGTVGGLKRAVTYPTFAADETGFLIMTVHASPIAPPATAINISISDITGNNVSLRLQGPPNTSVTIEHRASFDSGSWQLLQSGTTDGSGVLNHTDTGAANGPAKYYRVHKN